MINNIKRYHLILILFGLLATSCSTTKTIVIEVPKQGKQELPDRIQSLLIVNRTLDDSYENLDKDTLQNIFYAQGFNLDTVIHDKQAADTMLKAVSDLLFESGRYDVVIPEERFLPHEKNAFFTEALTPEETKQLCETFHTDAVLSVDEYDTRVVTKYNHDSYYNPFDGTFYSESEARMAIIYEALVKIYDPGSDQVLFRDFMRDTLVWEDYDESARQLFTHFTSVKQGLAEASIAMALDLSEKISTSWQREQRLIFVKGDEKLEQAAAFVEQGNWDSAIPLWEDLAANSSSKSLRSRAELNMAIAAELRGDIDQAIEWGLKSYNTMYQQVTFDYLEHLNRLKKQMEKQ
ncbi:MAG TPA: DUF6340 family protein [Draconibacterium sp.]|nr:DUF6340 family protein [Draconibacterium sp.]